MAGEFHPPSNYCEISAVKPPAAASPCDPAKLMRQHTIVPPSEDEEWHHLSGALAIDGEVAFITIAFEDAGEDGWAAEVFNSLRISEDVPVAE